MAFKSTLEDLNELTCLQRTSTAKYCLSQTVTDSYIDHVCLKLYMYGFIRVTISSHIMSLLMLTRLFL